jgi:hypothetical protein
MNSFHFRVPGAWPTERQIADSMGITGGTACSLWCRICARLGERAQ